MNITRIHDLLAHHAHQQPTAEAVVDEGQRLTYAQLADEVARYAKALIAAGVQPRDRVATLAPPCKHFWISYLATVSIGAIWMGLNPRYKERDYRYLLEDATPKVVLAVSPYDGRAYDAELHAIAPAIRIVTIGDAAAGVETIADFLAAGASISDATLLARQQSVQPSDTAVIVYTSGTTGQPKGAMLSHHAITGLALVNAQWMGAGLRKAIMPAPINHIGGLNNVCMNVFAYGGCIVFFHRVDVAAITVLTFTEKPTYLVSSPTAFRMLLDMPGFQPEMLKGYELIVFGGAKSPKTVLEPFTRIGARMSSVYGQTETTGIVTATSFDASLEVMAESFGTALSGFDLRIVDPSTLAPCADGEVGELQVKSSFVMSGYFNKPQATRDAFTDDGFLRTGDLCKRREDGNIEFVDRIKEMFKSGGYNVYPVEIEQVICEHESVAAAAVLKMPDAKFDEVGFAFVALKSGSTLDEAAIKSFLATRIANFKIPKRFEFVAALPLLPNSKVDKQTLKAQIASLIAEAV